MLNLQLPEGTDFAAAVFDQAGQFIMAGHREECELRAQSIDGLYCLIDERTGKPYIKSDFEGRSQDEFLSTAAGRETSDELMEAILYVAGNDAVAATRIWKDPTHEEALAIWGRVTRNGKDAADEFCWGVEGTRWAKSLGVES